MSPFLAQVQVINVTGDTPGRAKDTSDAAASTEMVDSLKELKKTADQIKAQARAQAAEAIKKVKLASEKMAADARAREDKSDDKSDEDQDSGSETTIRDGNGSIVVHRHGSNNADIPFLALPITTVVLVFIFLIIKTIMAPFTQRGPRRGIIPAATPARSQGLSEEEQAILLKLQRTLGQMERRVESLETILIDPARTKENYGTKQ